MVRCRGRGARIGGRGQRPVIDIRFQTNEVTSPHRERLRRNQSQEEAQLWDQQNQQTNEHQDQMLELQQSQSHGQQLQTQPRVSSHCSNAGIIIFYL